MSKEVLHKDVSDKIFDRLEVEVEEETTIESNDIKQDEIETEIAGMERAKEIVKSLTETDLGTFKGRTRNFFVCLANTGYPYPVSPGYPPNTGYPYPAAPPPPVAAAPPQVYRYSPHQNGFLRKVLLLVVLMLVVTTSVTFAYYYLRKENKDNSQTEIIIWFVCFVATAAIAFLVNSVSCARKVPAICFLILLGLGTWSYVTAFTAPYMPEHVVTGVLQCTCWTMIVCLVLAYTKFNFLKYTLFAVGVAAALVTSFIYCLILKFAFKVDVLEETTIPLFVILGTLGTSLALIFELHSILVGKVFKHLDNEYACVAFVVYLFLVNVSVKIIMIVLKKKRARIRF